MGEREMAYWRMLDTVEDYLRYGERTPHETPARVEPGGPSRSPRVRRSSGDAAGAGANPGGAAGGSGDAGAPAAGPPSPGADQSRDEADRRSRLARLEERVRVCTRCALHEGRMQAVPGEGMLDPLVMVVGEGPGADEDRRGLPFVGKAGQFLDRWLEAVDLDRRRNAYIGNVVKCRPPGNRDPRPEESDACLPYLREQIELIRPRTILTVGRVATGILVGTKAGITSLRGRTFYFNGIPLIPTFHPAAVLRSPDLKRPVWEDLKRLRALLDRDGGGG